MSDTPLDPEPAVPLDPEPEPDPVVAPEAVAAAASEPVVPSAVDLHVKLGPLQDPGVARPRAAQVWAWALAGGGLAGLASWLAGEYLLDWFIVEALNPEETDGAREVAAQWNAALAFGVFGALIGGLLGVAGAMVRQSSRAATACALLGIVVGGGVGARATFEATRIHSRAMHNLQAGAYVPAYHAIALGAVWGAVGAVGGAAFGAGMGGFRRAALGMLGGLLGGCLAAWAFELTSAAAFPDVGRSRWPISDSRESRLAAIALAALFISAGVALFVAPTRFEIEEEHETPPVG